MKPLKTLALSTVFMGGLTGLSPANATMITPAGVLFSARAAMTLDSPASLGLPTKCTVAIQGKVTPDGQSVEINQATMMAGGDQLCAVITLQNLPWTMKYFSAPLGNNSAGSIQGVNIKYISQCATTAVNLNVSWSGLYNKFSLPSTQTVGSCLLREFSFQPSPMFTFTP